MLKKKIEALLFSSGRKMSVGEISGLCHKPAVEIVQALNELKEKFTEDSSLMLVEEGDSWKLTPREDYLHLVRQIVTKTEMSKTLMETLAVIAFKYPTKQSDLIKIRTNKAYDHLKELEEMGYITRQKYGRTKLIKLTQKFFEYFSLKEDNLKDQFKDFDSIAHKIEEKEGEIKKIRLEQKKKAKEAGKKDKEIEEAVDKLGKDVKLIDDKGHKVKLEVVEEPKEKPKIKEYEDKLGDLEIIDEPEQPEEEITEEVEPEVAPVIKTREEIAEEKEKKEIVEKRVDEIKVEEVEPEVEKRVQEIFHPKEDYERKEKRDIEDPGDLYKADVAPEEESTEEEKEEQTEEPKDKE